MFKKLLLLLPLALLVVAACRPTLPPAPAENAVSEQQVLPAQVATKTPGPPPNFDPSPESLNLPPEFLKRDRTKGETLPGIRWGPENKGVTITIAGKKIKLPDDAYADANIVVSAICDPRYSCPKPPLVTIIRGNSKIGVSIADGKISGEKIAPGEEGIFDFLKRQLP